MFNYSYFSKFNVNQIFGIFIIGLRFDLTATIYFYAPLILLLILPIKIHQNIYSYLFLCVTAIIILLNLIDVAYFPFSSRRSGMELWSIQQELSYLLVHYLISYWYLFVVFIFLMIAAWFIYSKYVIINTSKLLQNKLSWFLVPVYLIILALMARGSIGLKPLNSTDASKLTKPELVPLLLNTPFQMIMSVEQEGINRYNYFDDYIARGIFNPIKQNHAVDTVKQNIVLIIVESLGASYCGFLNGKKGFTPFLDSLSLHSKVYHHAYANGKRSVEALPAILAGIPSLMQTDYLSSFYVQNKIDGIGNKLIENGYDVSFYHGGRNGTMGFDNFIAHTGGKYFGLNEYTGSNNDFDGTWGVSDFSYLLYFAKELDAKNKPFFSTAFTLSSHHPYKIPSDSRIKSFRPSEHPITKCIEYTDDALRNFFSLVKDKEWFKHTTFIITADHSADNLDETYKTMAGKFHIPLLIYSYHNKADNIYATVQQTDIPSIIYQLGGVRNYFSFANGLQDTPAFALQFTDQIYQTICWPYVYQFNGKEGVGFYNLSNDVLMNKNLIHQTQLYLYIDSLTKSVIQQYSNSLIDNKAYYR